VDIPPETLAGWFEFIGAIVAFVLGGLKLYEFWRDRVRLSIDVELDEFENYQGTGMDEPYSRLSVIADITNKGRVATTISKVLFQSENTKFTDIELYNRFHNTGAFIARSFEPTRIEGNDRIEIKISTISDYLENFEGLSGKLIFKTPHKDIIREIEIAKKEANAN